MTTTSATMMTCEEWQPVVGYEGFYEVSDQGRVRRIGGDMLKPKITGKTPYQYVVLCKPGSKPKRGSIHRLVATAFIPNPDGKPCVDHRGEITDNRVSMLRWATHSENQWNRTAVSGYKGVCWALRDKKWRAKIRVDSEEISLGYYDTAEEAYFHYCAAAAVYHGDFAHG